jgi:hypothetical protein
MPSNPNPQISIHPAPKPFASEIPRTTNALSRNISTTLGPKELVTVDELSVLAPELAVLFKLGHELVGRLQDTGVVYLLAHAGRELGRGVVRHLSDGAVQFSGTNGELPNNEDNRGRIGAVLQLPPDHSSVTAWFRLNGIFASACHYQVPTPSTEFVGTAFLQLSDLLYGRIAPYFVTHQELQKLLSIETPTEQDLERAKALLLRPQQRGYFFSQLRHSAWLGPLAEHGHFNTPPERIIESNGSWRIQGWPQGEYLARIAPQKPDAVTDLLLRIPPTLENPAVWSIVVDAAKELPISQGKRLVPTIIQALRTAPPVLFPYHAIDLVKSLAENGEELAFDLAKTLLGISKSPSASSATGKRTFLRSGYSKEAILERLDLHEVEELFKRALPPLEALNPLKTLKLLAGRLDRAVQLMAQNQTEMNHKQPDSLYWCKDLDHFGHSDDLRALFAVILTGVAIRLASRGDEDANSVWNELERFDADIFERIRLLLLAHVGPSLQQELDHVVGNEKLIDPPFGAREVAALLRAQFTKASPSARLLFRYSLERGPTADYILRLVQARQMYGSPRVNASESEAPITLDEISETAESWKKRRLFWFHDRIPLARPSV